MSGMKLPSVLQTKVIERPEVHSDVNTDLLFPVVFSQKSARFVFDRKGVLDSNSQLQISATVKQPGGAGNALNAFYPTSVGCLSLIKRAYLEIGGRRISDLQSLGHYACWKRLHFSNEYRTGIAIPKQSGNDVIMGSTARSIEAAPSATSIRARGYTEPYGVLGRVGSEYSTLLDTIPTGQQSASAADINEAPKRIITDDAKTTPTFSIGLSQLIPFLKNLQLPLFAMREEVSLTIEFSDPVADEAFVVPQIDSGGVPITATDCVSEIVEDTFFIMADYLFFPSMMAEISEDILERGGYDIPFNELIHQTNYLTYTTGEFVNELQIQVGGRKVRNLIIQHQQSGLTAHYGNYNSMALKGGMQYNYKVDSQNVYGMDLENTALQFQETSAVEGTPLMINNYLYTYKNQVDAAGVMSLLSSGFSDRLFQTYSQTLDSGSQNWIALKLENVYSQGKLLSNQPVIYTERGTVLAPDNNTSRTVRIWITIHRLLNISNGIVTLLE